MTFNAIRQYLEDGQCISRLVEQTLDDLDPGEVVIKTQFAAVNYKDARAVMGVGNVLGRLPCIPGVEMAGAVVESSHTDFKIGDLVTVQGGRDFGMKRDGAYSEYVRVPAKWIGRDEIAGGDKPLEKPRWAGAIDVVGGAPLDAVLRSAKKNAVICAFGNAASETLTTSIYPFILRSVSLIGINGNHPVPKRGEVWARMAKGGDLHPKHLHQIAYPIRFEHLLDHCGKVMQASIRGRAVVTFN